MGCVHLAAAIPDFDVLEYHALAVDWWDDPLQRSDPLIEDGYVEVPEKPGFGVELDEDVADAYRLGGEGGFR